MPRRTAKSKAINENLSVKALNSKTTKQKNNGKKEKCIKKELDTPKESIVEEVVHRKSERRRVARDIFLVFEEESNSKRKSRTNKKQIKPKFGHLKIEDPIRPKGLLRDIKNEPKCYLKNKINTTVSHDVPISKADSKLLETSKVEKKLKNEKSKISAKEKISACSKKLNNVKSLKITTLKPETCTFDNDKKFVARVNPIFLWVKQDDTRIVEVRCEDYDKRNRIRITKTANGWRSIPRSDPTTSRVLKFNPTPLMKVKRENNVHEGSNMYNSKNQNKNNMVCKNFPIPTLTTKSVDNDFDSTLVQNGVETVCNPLAIKNVKSKRKKPKKPKKKSNVGNPAKESEVILTAESKTVVNNDTITTHFNPPFSTKSSVVRDFPVHINAKLECYPNKEEMLENPLDTKNLVESLPVSIFNCNNEVLEGSIVSSSPSLASTIPSATKSTYQEIEEDLCFHLCPKTGLFVANNIHVTEYENESYENIIKNASKAEKHCFLSANKDEFNNIDIEKDNLESKTQISEENIESLEAKTKNLKDLLDDADLLQNCDDNTNSDADLIDNLVKTSCENNLIQANEITKASAHQIPDHVQLIADVSDPPKCLSFNEAGEIEDLSEEIFQSNTFMESFEKQSTDILTDSQVILHSTSTVVETSINHQKTSLSENIEPVVLVNVDKKSSKVQEFIETEESPKDLSYKKREEVCPQSESRSQCAVTSSSDVIKSPQHGDETSLDSPSETLKNLILEQFMKLNALTTQHQRETTVSDKQKHSDIPNMKSVYSKPEQSSNIIETVVIDDDYSDTELEEPLKKRLRLQKPKVISQNKLAMIDKDPDPLTQLRLLIRNTQWKVPDPILVPKDRLSAVLASPAREIPLLITTRPELRLPEAFAYPEIIQNPNILVISMAQLEAILKNELQVEKEPLLKSVKTDSNQQLSEEQVLDGQLTNRVIDLQLPTPEQHFKHTSKLAKNISTNTNTTLPANNKQAVLSESLPTSREYAKISQTDSSSSDLNSAAMSVLNQMLWLPYFGHISQEISKYIKSPTASQEKCSNSASMFNSSVNGITNFEDIFKNTDKLNGNSILNTGLQAFQQQFKTNEELSFFQKIVQHQMKSVLQLNQLPAAESTKLMTSLTPESSNFTPLVDKSKSKIEPQTNLSEQRKQKHFSSNKQTSTSVCKNQTNNISHNITLPEKSYNLRSSVAGRHSIESKQYSNNNQRHLSENKPRLTCKSLSNLIDPEHSIIPSSSSVVFGQNSTGFLYSDNETKRSSTESKVIENNAEQKGHFLANAAFVPQSQKSCGNIAGNIVVCNEIQKGKPKSIEQSSLINDATSLTADSNAPLWHPLFGSNTKTAYSSPWQWTTVTATGE